MGVVKATSTTEGGQPQEALYLFFMGIWRAIA